MRILVVEDESELRQAIARYLRGQGHAVDECETCRSASETVHVYEHDVIVLDRMLPDGDSIKMLDGWRAEGKMMVAAFQKKLSRNQGANFELPHPKPAADSVWRSSRWS